MEAVPEGTWTTPPWRAESAGRFPAPSKVVGPLLNLERRRLWPHSPPAMPESILLVEDDSAVRAGLEKLLAGAGWSVAGVGTLAAARTWLADSGPDLLVLDLHLPDGNGLELLDEVKEGLAAPAVLVLTGTDDLSIAVQAMQQGAYDFLAKPVERDRLLEVVRCCLSDRAGSEDTDAPDASESRAVGRGLVGFAPEMLEVFKLMGLAATSRSPVLIRGASGTGKELVARSIHRHQMPGRPFVAVNCAALPDGLLESELFGHERGAFTGAAKARKGSFEMAGDGTVLLDEIGDTSPAFQTKLLRVLQEEEFSPLGSGELRPFQGRVMAATHRPLEAMMEAGSFRVDLYYRLRVIEIEIPPLSERRQDIPGLTRHLLAKLARRLDKPAPRVPPAVMRTLEKHDWPGNVRELENALARAVALSRGPILTLEDLGLGAAGAAGSARPGPTEAPAEASAADTDEPETLDEVIAAHAREMLERVGGNKREAARRLEISPARLYRILSED